MMSRRKGIPGLFEFLEEADLNQFYHGLRNVLRVYQVDQAKCVTDEDLFSIGMSRSEARRLRAHLSKHNTQTYSSKLKKLLLPNHKSKDEFLLDDSNDGGEICTMVNHVQHDSGIKVPIQHIISSENVKICKELGAGEFGIVEQGILTDKNKTHQVAIKSLYKDRMSHSMFEFMKEYEIMQSIEHENVVKLFGVVLESSRIMLITELAPLRSLLECLKEPSLRPTLTVVCLCAFTQQICEGMKYLESKRLIHRDLAARNILVFSKHLVKVSDFGLSRALGVGKDYYQTNFNANLKLPIAWCAPECITFLKFTSASDVWAFAVTLWEIFSYGFQPWAAHTGQQILEAIDEPYCQRLDQPLHCPAEYYSVMLMCWTHDPNARPTFADLVSILDDAKPEQVQAVQPMHSHRNFEGLESSASLLQFDVGTIITVLDKNPNLVHSTNSSLWTGVRDDTGVVGLFSPSQTVAYVNTMPTTVSAASNRKWQRGGGVTGGGPSGSEILTSDSILSVFQRASYRSLSRSSRGKLSRDMISGPRGQVQHTAHVGIDGMHFGNVAGFFDFKSSYASMPCLVAGQSKSMSLGPSGDSSSELAPLITTRTKNSLIGHGKKSNTFDGHNSKTNKHQKLGAYLAKNPDSTSPSNLAEKQKHEYHSISDKDEEEDDLFSTPPDLGPSLVDEVFGELGAGAGLDLDDRRESKKTHEDGKKSTDLKDLKDLVTSLTITRKPKQKKAPTVKPIKASDKKTLENAIAMANALASKSMHELDKRTTDHFYDSSPGMSPLTPNSPTKKFNFWFPSSGGPHHPKSSSPHNDRKPFSDEVNSNLDLESTLSIDEKNAYKALIEGVPLKQLDDEFDVSGGSEFFSDSKKSPFEYGASDVGDNNNTFFYPEDDPSTVNNNHMGAYGYTNGSNNPLPLPPKTVTLTQTSSKRHVRKNPLILPSSRVTNLISKSEMVHDTPTLNLMDPPTNRSSQSSRRSTSSSSFRGENTPNRDIGHTSDRRQTYHFDEGFEDAIASQIDALDNIAEDTKNLDVDLRSRITTNYNMTHSIYSGLTNSIQTDQETNYRYSDWSQPANPQSSPTSKPGYYSKRHF